MDLNLYDEQIQHEGFSVFSGGEKNGGAIHYSEVEKISPVLKAFLDDDDLQELSICSSNIGFVRTYRKIFKRSL